MRLLSQDALEVTGVNEGVSQWVDVGRIDWCVSDQMFQRSQLKMQNKSRPNCLPRKCGQLGPGPNLPRTLQPPGRDRFWQNCRVEPKVKVLEQQHLIQEQEEEERQVRRTSFGKSRVSWAGRREVAQVATTAIPRVNLSFSQQQKTNWTKTRNFGMGSEAEVEEDNPRWICSLFFSISETNWSTVSHKTH